MDIGKIKNVFRAGIKLNSVEDASVIRKFSVLFALMSFLPFIILAVIFFFFISDKQANIQQDFLFWSVFLVGIFSLLGFIGIRKTLLQLIKVSNNAQEILKGDLTKRININTDADNEVARMARSFNEIVQQLENNIKQLEKSRKTVQEVLLKIAGGTSSMENIDAFLELILSVTVDAVGGNYGMLLVIEDPGDNLIVKSAYGLESDYPVGKRISAADEVTGWVAKQKKPLLIPRLHKVSPGESEGLSVFDPPLICAPLVFHNKSLGAILISGKKEAPNFEEDELVILSNIASQIALAMENSRLNADNQKAYFETITALALAVEARDVYSRGHSDRVGEYALKIAQQLNLNEQQIKTIKETAQLHDVGKIGISDDILRKTEGLNDVERKIMEQHPIIGEGIIIPLHGFAHLRDAIRHHHEWLDGSGYPDHLKDGQISLEAQVLSVADCFDAMTTDRPYQKGKTPQEAKAELLQYAGIRYDKKIVDALIEALKL